MKTINYLQASGFDTNLNYISSSITPTSLISYLWDFLAFGFLVLGVGFYYYRKKKDRDLLQSTLELTPSNTPISLNKQNKIDSDKKIAVKYNNCTQCNHKNSLDDIFCQNCGDRL